MKYVVFVLKSIVLWVFQGLVTVIGWMVIPFFLTRVEEFDCLHGYRTFRFKDKWFDNIFGNYEDGIDYDVYSLEKLGGKEKLNLWTRYKWCAYRNSVHNLALRMGVNEKIVEYTWKGNRYTEDRVGCEGWLYSEAKGESGKVYPLFRWCKMWLPGRGVEFGIGYKNFNIKEVPAFYTYSFTVSINPFKKFEPGREG